MPGIWGPNTIPSITPVFVVTQNAIPIAAVVTQNEASIFGTLASIRGRITFAAVGTTAFPLTLLTSIPGYTFKATQYGIPIGQFVLTQLGSGTKYEGSIILSAAGTFILVVSGQNNFLGVAPAYAAAVGDILVFSILVPLS